MSKKLTQQEFTNRLKKAHGDNIDFSKSVFSGIKGKIKCICHKHKKDYEWEARFDHLADGIGCAKCSGHLKYRTTEQVLEELIEKHPKIIFGEFNYKNNLTKVPCVCGVCKNEWVVVYAKLIGGVGCHKCKIKESNNLRSQMEDIKIICPKVDFSKFEYINMKTKSVCICRKCKKEWLVNPEKLKSGTGCPHCSKNKKLTNNEALEKLTKKCLNIDFSQFVYVNSQTNGICICKKCSYEWKTSFSGLMQGKGCPNCYGNIKKTQKKAIFILEQKFPDIDFCEFKYKSAIIKSTCICRLCGNRWIISYNSIVSNKSGCPKCKQSYYERKTEDLLIKYGIKYEVQKQFDSCRYKRKLKFDFYLQDFNVLIEYNGAQHFKQFKYTNLSLIKLRDFIKANWCAKNKIQLIRISDSPYKTNDNISLDKFEFFLKELKT